MTIFLNRCRPEAAKSPDAGPIHRWRHASTARRFACIAVALLIGSAAAQAAETIRVVTEELPPYHMVRDGRVTGLDTDIVVAVMKKAGIVAPIEVMPWARAYETALTEPNVLIYSMSQTPERSKLFKWIGELGSPDKVYFYALTSRHLSLRTIGDARDYRIAIINGDVGESYLLANGFTVGANLSRSNKTAASYEKLKAGRVDLWLASELTAAYTVRSSGDDPAHILDRLLMLPALGSDERALMAFGPNTPDALVEKFRAGLRAIHDDGTFEAIERKWH